MAQCVKFFDDKDDAQNDKGMGYIYIYILTCCETASCVIKLLMK